MIVGIGTDLCDLRRLHAATQRRGAERFAHRVLGDDEHAVWQARAARHPARGLAYLGTRFAVKEAFAKAIGLGLRSPMRWRSCQTLNRSGGAPMIVLSGDLADWFNARRWRAHVTLTDEQEMAAAFVVVESAAPDAGPESEPGPGRTGLS